MRHRIEILIIVLVAVSLFPCYVFAQGDGRPPTCCNEDPPPPPPPPGGDAVAPGTGTLDMMPQTSISDASLRAMGITRSQFLDRLAAALFTDPSLTVDLVIPIISQTSSPDGSTIVQVSYYQIHKNLVAPAIIYTLDLLFITDGQIYMEVIFIRDPAP